MVLDMKSFAPKNYALLFQILGSSHDQVVEMQCNFARENGDYELVLAILQKVLEKQNLILSESILATKSHIALVLRNLGRFHEALELIGEMLKYFLGVFEGDNQITMGFRHNMGMILQDTGDMEGAKSIYHEVLDWQKQNYGDFHPATLDTRYNLAVILFKQKKFEEAKTEIETVLSLKK